MWMGWVSGGFEVGVTIWMAEPGAGVGEVGIHAAGEPHGGRTRGPRRRADGEESGGEGYAIGRERRGG